jgi:hypothetical protein
MLSPNHVTPYIAKKFKSIDNCKYVALETTHPMIEGNFHTIL